MPTVLAPPSKSYYDYITAKKNGAVPTASLDVSAVHVTGFTLRSEEDQAKAVLKPGETLSFDPYLGSDRHSHRVTAARWQLEPTGGRHSVQAHAAAAEGARCSTIHRRHSSVGGTSDGSADPQQRAGSEADTG